MTPLLNIVKVLMAEEKRAAAAASAKAATTATATATTAKRTAAPAQPATTAATTTAAPAKIPPATNTAGSAAQNVWLQRAQRMSTGNDKMKTQHEVTHFTFRYTTSTSRCNRFWQAATASNVTIRCGSRCV